MEDTATINYMEERILRDIGDEAEKINKIVEFCLEKMLSGGSSSLENY